MLRPNMTKSEVEKELAGKGPFVQIDHLTRFLRESLSMDMKKFVFLKLSELYEKAGMLKEAAKNCSNAAMISLTFNEKMRHFVKEAELYVRADDFERADEAMRKSMNEANSIERNEISITVKEFYKRQAQAHEKSFRRGHAVRIYEKLLGMKISDFEKKEIKEKLLDLYKKLGKIREYAMMEKGS